MCQSRATSMILDAEVLLSFCCHHGTFGCDQCLLHYWWGRMWKVRIQTYFIRAKSDSKDNNAFQRDCMLCDSGCKLMWECGSLSSLSWMFSCEFMQRSDWPDLLISPSLWRIWLYLLPTLTCVCELWFLHSTVLNDYCMLDTVRNGE